jgi:hypothetical protein
MIRTIPLNAGAARAILTDPGRAAADPSLARIAWLTLAGLGGVRVVQHRLPRLPLPHPDHAARRARLRRDLLSLPDGDAA